MRFCLSITLLLSLVLVSVSNLDATAFQAEGQVLTPGRPIEREIIVGETHFYHLTLSSQYYFFARVEQYTVDVRVKILRPDGQVMAEFHHPGGTADAETVMFIAETAGLYRFEIRPASPEGARGKYGIHIKELRAAQQPDEIRIRAEKLYLDGMWAFGGDTASKQRALEMLRQAGARWHELNDPQGEGRALNMLGLFSGLMGERRNARDFYQQALPLARVAGDAQRQVEILNMLGTIFRDDGDFRKAQEHFMEAASLAHTLSDKQPEIKVRVQQGWLSFSLWKDERALEFFETARQLGQEMTDPELKASYSYGLCAVYRRLGDSEQALQYCWAALKSNCNCNMTRAEVLKELGLMMFEREDFDRAREYLNEALTLIRPLGIPNIEAEVWGRLGRISLLQHDIQQSLSHFNQMLFWAQRAGGGLRQSEALMALGEAQLEAGDLEKARDYFEQADIFNRSIGMPSPYAKLGLAKVCRARSELREALVNAEAAADIIETSRSAIYSPALRASWFAGAQNIYRFYFDLLMQLDREQPSRGYAEKAFTLIERSRARSLLDSLGEARADIREGVEPELLDSERGLQSEINEHAQRMSGKNSSQLAREKERLETLLNKYQLVQSQIRSRSPRYTALMQPQPLSLAEIQHDVLDEGTLLLEFTLGEPRSYLWAVTRSSWTVYELPSRTDIEPAAARFYNLLKMGDKIELRSQVKLAAANLGSMILGPAAPQLGTKRLLIVADGALQYIPFAALPEPLNRSQRSSREGQPLAVNHEIVYLPSASIIALLRREFFGRTRASRAVLAFADPVLSGDDLRLKALRGANKSGAGSVIVEQQVTGELRRSAREMEVNLNRLTFTRAEAEYIAGIAREQQGVALLDFDANKKRVFDPDLSQYRIVHLATHGLLNTHHPELSGFVLSLVDETGRPQDGFLRLHDIYNLKLNAELVVLSACRTAVGKDVKGEGLLGLTRGFMYAGTPRVVASLWDVRDEATAILMKKFYRNMLTDGLRPVAALRMAQLSMLREPRWAAPYYWAGFVMQGEWR